MPVEISLIATLPQSSLVATSLGIEGFGWHLSPGSAKYFHGRSIFLELPHTEGKPSFAFLDEGSWRDAAGDTVAAIRAALNGKRTKTALSNDALNCVPIDAVKRCFLVKTSGRALELQGPREVVRFTEHSCDEALTSDQVGAKLGRAPDPRRGARFYMVLAPIELLVLSNLSPEEYAWYATHRPGKVFRQLAFAEVVGVAQRNLVAQSVLQEATQELMARSKKTKTLISGDLLNRIPFQDWVGFGNPAEGGLYLADRHHLEAWRFPNPIPSQWSRADG